MNTNMGIDKRVLAYYTPTPNSLTQRVINYFETFLASQFQEADLSIAQVIMMTYLDQKTSLFQILYSWRSQINYVYLLGNTKLLRSEIQRVIDEKRTLLSKHGAAMASFCNKGEFDEEDFECYLMDFSRQRTPLNTSHYQQICQQQQ